MEHRPVFEDQINLELHRMTEPPRACGYLPGRTASLEYRLIAGATPETCEQLVVRGWRRFGISFFRPGCLGCAECRSLRVPVARFKPTKSQRRCLKRNSDVTAMIRRPGISRAHIRLYNAYHRDMHRRRGWPDQPITAREYAASFVMGAGSFGHEIQYFKDGRLAGVGLVDILPGSISSIYFYHDPEWRQDGPGTFSILREIRLARRTGRQHLYLGYWIRDNPSMSYKSRFTPHEILHQYVDDDQPPSWRPPSMRPE